jgi:vacuolar-type H+-ATPase subunit I/STV1
MAFSTTGDQIQILVEVDNSQGVKKLNDTEKAINQVGKETKELEKGLSGLQKGLLAVGAAAATAFTLDKLFDAIRQGSQVDDLTNSFERLASQAGTSAEALRRDLSQAVGGTISNMEIMRRSNELMIAGLNPSTFDEMAQAARSLADATGRELAPTLDQVSDALIRGNDRGLKALGVQVDLKQAQEDFARSIGTTADKLNEAGQIESARIAMLEALKQKTQELGVVTNDSADNLDVMSVTMQNVGAEVSKAIATNPELNRLLAELAAILQQIDFSGVISGLSQFTSGILTAGEKTADFVNWLTEPEGLIDGLNVLKYRLQGLPQDVAEYAAAQERFLRSTQESKKATEELSNEVTDLGKIGINKATQEFSKYIKPATQSAEATKKLADEIKKLNSIAGIKKVADDIGAIYTNAKKLGIPIDQATKEVTELIAEFKKLGGTGVSAIQAIDAALLENQRQLEENAAKMAELDQELAGSNDFFGLTSKMSDEATKAAKAVADAMARSLAAALTGGSAREEVDASIQQLGGDLGEQLGGEIGGSLGRVLGEFLGDKLGDVISSFGEDSAGTKARKALDKFFADAFKDLQFSGNQDPTQGLFAGLTEQAKAQFNTLGDTIAQTLGVGTDSGVNLGVVLANNNVTLAEMGTILDELGLSFEQLSATMYQAFYEGELSALDLQNKLEEIYGIVSYTDAFENLGDAVREALNADGRALLGSLRAIGAEAQQLGISTLPQLANVLVSKFGLAADQVNAIIASMSAAGVSAVQDLVNASNNTLIAISANIQQVKNGETPNNTPVNVPKSSSSSGGSRASSGGSSTRTKRDPAEDARREIERLYQLVDRSDAAKELQKKIADGLINDQQYAEGINTLMKQAGDLQKKVNKEQKEFLEAQRKNSKDKVKELKEFEKAKEDLEKLLNRGSSSSNGNDLFSINSPLLSFIKEFRGQTELLNIAAQSAGVSFQQIQANAERAFLAGKQTFAEAKNAIDELTGGKDAKKQLDKFRDLGTKGGALSVEAFRNIGKSIQNIGGTSIDNLSEYLLGQGANREEVQKFFIAMQNSGINSLDQIANASTETVITIGNQLQDLKFPFKETQSETQSILDKLDQIRNSDVKAKINLSVDISDEDRALLLGYGIIKPGDIKDGEVTASVPYNETSLGLTKESVRKKYRELLKSGKTQKAAKYKANNAQYF